MTMFDQAARATLRELDAPTRALVRVAAIVAAGTESEVRAALGEASRDIPHPWIEELLLQTYLFAGFPRALNAFREWRRLVPAVRAAGGMTPEDQLRRGTPDHATLVERGVATCRAVYGAMYDKLRLNIEALHPDLDWWMVVEGYGKVLSRPGLDLPRRELCIVAACVASGQDRQLHSHLHGALNVGVTPDVVRQSLDGLAQAVPAARVDAARLLLARVVGK